MLDNLSNGLYKEDLDYIFGGESEEEIEENEKARAFLEDLETDMAMGK